MREMESIIIDGEAKAFDTNWDLEKGLDTKVLENLASDLQAIKDRQPKGFAIVPLDAALNSCIIITLQMYYRNPNTATRFTDATTGFVYAFDDAGWFNIYDIDAKLGEERLNRGHENLGKELGKKIREQHEKEELAALQQIHAPTKEQLASFELAHMTNIGDPSDNIVFMDSSDTLLSLTTAPMSFDIINDNETLVSIDMDTGEVEFGENYTPSKAAKIFWDALGVHHPYSTKWDTHEEETAYDSAMSLLGSYNG